jgi:hypothetical protein
MHAIFIKNLNIIRLLLEYGADRHKLPNNTFLLDEIKKLCEEYEYVYKEPE